MGWNLADLKAAHREVPEKQVEEYYRAHQQEAGAASRAKQARRKIKKVTGKPFGKRKD